MIPASAASGQSPLVTIITATYNSSYTLRCTLKSIQAQSFNNFEALVIGDHCTDDSASAVSELQDPRFRWINLPHRIGTQSGPNNEGLRQARGEYIAYLGHDDLWFPWHLTELVTAIQNGNADFVHSGVFLLYPDGSVQIAGGPSKRYTYAQRSVPPSGWLHRRAIIERSGHWPSPEEREDPVDLLFQRNALLAHAIFAPTGHFTVLKFPSPSWNLYGRTEEWPQPQYLLRLQNNSEELMREVFTAAACTAGATRDSMEIRPILRRLVTASLFQLKDSGLLNPWPLRCFLRWKYNRARRSINRQRGLRP